MTIEPDQTTSEPLPEADGLCRLPATELAGMIAARRLSVVEAVTAFLDRIDRVNGAVNAIVSLRDRGEVLAEARTADQRLAAGEQPGPLFGLPIAVKDLALTKGLRTTFGSRVFADFVPGEDDCFVARMRAAGAIIIGKTNVPEFGFGSQTYNQMFGTTLNALDRRLTAGGSSGGGAVALALGMLPLADGSDMCGSLRNPAGWNNVFGFRPSQGRVPGGRAIGDLFMAQMGIEGPMARNVADLALLLRVQAGYDPGSPLSLDGSVEAVSHNDRSWRVAWLGDLGSHLAMESGVIELCEAALTRAENGPFRVEPLVPAINFEALWQAFVTLRHATGGAALKPLYDDPKRHALLKPEVVWEIEGVLGLTALEVHTATTIRSDWYRCVLKLFERYDLLALPTAQVFAFDATRHWPAEVAGRVMDSYHRWMEVTAYATMAGCPTVAVPAGFDAAGRAMGIQLIGRPRGDAEVLAAAADYEQVCEIRAGA